LSSILPKIFYKKVLTNTLPYGNILIGICFKEVSKWAQEREKSGEMTTDEVERKLRELIDEVLELRKMWEQRRLEAENQVKSLDAKLTAYQVALKDYWEHLDIPNKLK
jgi:hypothetical protein